MPRARTTSATAIAIPTAPTSDAAAGTMLGGPADGFVADSSAGPELGPLPSLELSLLAGSNPLLGVVAPLPSSVISYAVPSITTITRDPNARYLAIPAF